MEFLFVMVIVALIYFITPKPNEVGGSADKFVIEKKKCPPHKWRWQDVVDQHGEKHGERIVCDVCGPLRGSSE